MGMSKIGVTKRGATLGAYAPMVRARRGFLHRREAEGAWRSVGVANIEVQRTPGVFHGGDGKVHVAPHWLLGP